MFALEYWLLAQIKINSFAVTIEIVVSIYFSDYFQNKRLTQVYLITFLEIDAYNYFNSECK